MERYRRLTTLQVALCGPTLAGGGVLFLLDMPRAANGVWLGGAAVVLVAVLLDTAAGLWHKKVGLDLIALVSLGGALALEENLAAVIALMSASGAWSGLPGSRKRRPRAWPTGMRCCSFPWRSA